MIGTTEVHGVQTDGAPAQPPMPRLTYVAYPSSLVLRAANAVQTFHTAQELRRIAPDFQLLIPRFAFRESAFTAVGATHLVRLPFNAGRHAIRSVVWSYMERTWFAWRVLAHMLRARARHQPPAVVYVRDIVCAAWFALLAQRLIGAQVVFEVHDLEAQNPSANSGPVARWLARRMDGIALSRADGIVSLTATFLPQISAVAPETRTTPITVIPDAYDDAVYYPQPRDGARDALGIAADAFVVTYTGLTFSYHGVDLLVDAFASCAATLPNALLILVGGRDSERAAMHTQAADRGVQDHLRIVPPQAAPTVASYLAAADVLIIPDTVSKASASPLKLFEYAAMRRPIVAADLPALREILPDDAARYVAPGAVTGLADGIRWVAAHPADAAAMAARASIAVTPYTYRARAAAIARFARRLTGSDE